MSDNRTKDPGACPVCGWPKGHCNAGCTVDAPQSTETELVLLIKRNGIDKSWHQAPYQIKSKAGAEKLVAWLRQSLPPFEYRVVTL